MATTQRNPVFATPRRFIIARWKFSDVVIGREWEGDPLCEQSYDTFERLREAVSSGEIDHLTQAVEVDLSANTAIDITDAVYLACAEHTFNKEQPPHETLADEFDARGLGYLTHEAIEAEAASLRRWYRSQCLSAHQLGIGR